MQSRDFCYWLQGYFEIVGAKHGEPVPALSADQVDMVRKHLDLVFAHEIDPAMGGPQHQSNLNAIHSKPPFDPTAPRPRC